MNRATRIKRYWAVFYAYMAAVIIVSGIPDKGLPVFEWTYTDIFFHFFEYALFGVLCMRAMRVSYGEASPDMLFFAGLLFCMLFSISDELHQHFVPGRTLEVKDIFSDILGSIFGLFVYSKVYERLHGQPFNKYDQWL